MAIEDFMERVNAAEDAATWARTTADTINCAAWGVNNTESGPPWAALHSHTVDALCVHIEALAAIIRNGGSHG